MGPPAGARNIGFDVVRGGRLFTFFPGANLYPCM